MARARSTRSLAALGGERRTAAGVRPARPPDRGVVRDRRRPPRAGDRIVETAAASGLGLVEPGERDPFAASTFGTGQLILAAIEAGAELVYLGVGGSATTDGGAGAIRAIREGGGLGDARIVVLSDVRTPFEHAARVFGPQKGADDDQVRRLTRRLDRPGAAADARPARGSDDRRRRAGCPAGCGPSSEPSWCPAPQFVLDAVDFDRRMRAARAVVTGEGKLDQQSLAGKVVSEVSTRARQAGVPCHAIVGTLELDTFGVRVLDLQAVLEASTPRQISAAARRLAEVL